MIRRLAARGVKQKDIAEKVGLTRTAVTKIVSGEVKNSHEPTVNATTPAAEIEAKQAEVESLRKHLKDEQSEQDELHTPGPITKNNVPEEFFAPLKEAGLHVVTGWGSFLAGGGNEGAQRRAVKGRSVLLSVGGVSNNPPGTFSCNGMIGP